MKHRCHTGIVWSWSSVWCRILLIFLFEGRSPHVKIMGRQAYIWVLYSTAAQLKNISYIVCYIFLYNINEQGFVIVGLFASLIKKVRCLYSHLVNLKFQPIGQVNNIPTLQFFTGISRNLLCYHWLSLSGNPKIIHCVILINMPYSEFYQWLWMSVCFLFCFNLHVDSLAKFHCMTVHDETNIHPLTCINYCNV